MKRLFSIILILLMSLSFISCNKNKVVTLKTNVNNQSTIELTKEELQDKIENEESFMLVIMLESCSSCEQFKKDILVPYIKETHATIYSINSYELDSLPRFDNKPKYKIAPNVQIYFEGESVLSLNYDEKKEVFKNVEGFKKFMIDYIITSPLIEVDENNLDNLIKQKETFILYIGWYKCGDCVSISNNVLDQYLFKNEVSINMFYLESDKYRANKPSNRPVLSENPTEKELEDLANYEAWVSFARKYGFVSYRDGRVPTLQYYENGVVKDMVIYKNDVIEDNKIIESYYPEIIGKTYSSEELLEFHNNKIIEFLNKYYK